MEAKRKLGDREKKQKYMSELSEQIKRDKEKSKFDALMTEHERRVNNDQIEAYTKGKNQMCNSNLI